MLYDFLEQELLPAAEALGERWPSSSIVADAAVSQLHNLRGAALQALVEKWPDETTRKLLAKRARIDGVAASLFGGQHSEFGRIVLTNDLDGRRPYLDPTKPISRVHIERAAKKSGITEERIDEAVRSLCEHLGWDITRGSAGP